ncbi:hypothetical protein [Flavobacterium davisii]|uniref:hypothetical protein n=1 Tax=Flavobacterium davisii TaxID=2906077 RepID=UPI0035D1115D
MKFIPPLEISSKIMTLIEEANQELILVSPYVEISKWDKMKKCLERAVNRKVKITFIARKNAKQDLSFLEHLGINLILINDLHAKLYLNETYGIVTSQNLVYYSDINSIDIAHQTESNSEKKELVDFISKYVINIESTKKTILFEKIKSQNYDTKVQLKEFQLDKLWQTLINYSPNSFFKKASSYVFCDDVLPFADVMVDTRFIIKINKQRTDCEQILTKLQTIGFEFKHDFKVELLISHKSFYYIEFIPIDKIDFENLEQDFIELIDCILKSDIHKILKIQKKNTFW